MSKETKKVEVKTYKQFIDILSEMGDQGKIDAQTRWDIMSMVGDLSLASFNRGQEQGIYIMDKVYKM